MEYIRAVNNHFRYKGEHIRLRGFGIGTWLCLEHFMMGLPTSEQMIHDAFRQVYGISEADAFFSVYRNLFLCENDFRFLKECGINFIRIPFNYRLFIDDNNPDVYKEDGFAQLDRLLSLCNKNEVFALIDLHTTPGAQNPDWHSDNSYGVSLFWKYRLFRRQITELWAAIASRYCNEPFLMGYDLLNEPAMTDWQTLNTFYKETIAEIRKVDKNHVIVLEGDQFSMDFAGLEHFQDDQIALGFHYYPTVWHPELLDRSMNRGARKKAIADGLDALIRNRESFHCPAFCGEFGYAAAECGGEDFSMELLNDTIELMEERKIDWALWCYKDTNFMSIVSPKRSSAWMKLASSIREKWTQDIEKRQVSHILDTIQEKWFPQMTGAERYQLQFRLRACLYVLQQQHILLFELQMRPKELTDHMAMDFLLENCVVNMKLKNLIESFSY